MLRTLFYIFLVSNFACVQSLASICKTKCSVLEVSNADKQEQKNEQQNCHSAQDSDSKKSGPDCNDVCQSDDIIKSDAEHFSFLDVVSNLQSQSEYVEVDFLNHELIFTTKTHDPPGHSFYSGISIFIQKSSFLI